MTQATYDTIIQATVLLGQEDNRYIIGAYTEIAKDWLENRLRDIVQRALSSVVGEAVKVEFVLLNEED
jgi:chromosomal replication initiation ATPase DnaA